MNFDSADQTFFIVIQLLSWWKWLLWPNSKVFHSRWRYRKMLISQIHKSLSSGDAFTSIHTQTLHAYTLGPTLEPAFYLFIHSSSTTQFCSTLSVNFISISIRMIGIYKELKWEQRQNWNWSVYKFKKRMKFSFSETVFISIRGLQSTRT